MTNGFDLDRAWRAPGVRKNEDRSDPFLGSMADEEMEILWGCLWLAFMVLLIRLWQRDVSVSE